MLGARTTRSLRALVTIITGAILWTSIATIALAADKTYTASFVSSVFDAGASYGVAPRAALQLKLQNSPTSQVQLGSANVSQPLGVKVTSAAIGATPVVVSDGVMQLRNLGLAPGAQVTVSVSAEVECGPNHGSYVWPIAAKQANDFNGTGNDNVQNGSLTNTVTGNCALVFSKQPKAAENSPDEANNTVPITNKIYDPSGDAVTVTVKDGAGLQTVAWWSGTITLIMGFDPTNGSAVLGGDLSGSASGGSVEFAPTISLAASGYSLKATPSLMDAASTGTLATPVESASFNIVDDAGICTSANSTCSAHSQGPKTDVLVTAGTGGAAGDLAILSLNDPTVTAPSCGGGYVPTSDLIVFNITTSDGTTASNRPKTVTLTMPAALVTKSASKYQVCFQGENTPAKFLTACANKNPVLPCVLSQALDKDKNLVIVVAAPKNDPKLNF
jgi:hypothetical protein